MRFEWDSSKAQENLEKHGVSFEETTTAFGDPLSSTVYDPDHSHSEDRFLLFGLTDRRTHIVAAYTERDGIIRVISARKTTRREIRAYEQ